LGGADNTRVVATIGRGELGSDTRPQPPQPHARIELGRRIHMLGRPGVEDPSLDHLVALPHVRGGDSVARADDYQDSADAPAESG